MNEHEQDQRELELQLVRRPQDAAVRSRYAALLLQQQMWNEALTQFELLVQAEPSQATAFVGAARCLLAQGNTPEAMQLYSQAHNLEGFVSDPELQAAWENVRPKRGRLHAISTNTDNVVPLVSPSSSRISFDDVAGMEDLKKTLRMQIIEPFQRPGLFARFRKKAGGGVLLYGPPGCGKTMMARAIATECRASFISVGITDVLSAWIGGSEQNLALMFQKARADKPAVLFFDELDALAYSRSKAQSEHTRQTVNEFLSQLDGFEQNNEGALVLAATNMPWDVDSAIKRPGRFEKQIFVPPPDAAARAALFEMKLKQLPCDTIDYRMLAARTEYCSGADVDGIIDAAKEYVLADIIHTGKERNISADDLTRACEGVTPSTLDWLRTARNLVKYGGGDQSYKQVEAYLKNTKFR